MSGRGSKRIANGRDRQASSSQDAHSSGRSTRSSNTKEPRIAIKSLRSSASAKTRQSDEPDDAHSAAEIEVPLISSQDERNLRRIEDLGRAKLEVPDGMMVQPQVSTESLSQSRSQRSAQAKSYAESDAEDGDENDASFDAELSKKVRKAKEESVKKLFVPTFLTKGVDKSLADVSMRSMNLLSEINAHYKSAKRSSQAASHIPEKVTKKMTHCPFCKKPLPRKWFNHKDLRRLMQEWLTRYHEADGDLGATSTVALCTLHHDLRDVIPEGRKRKWPKILDVDELRRDILNKPSIFKRLRARIERPESSDWFCALKAKRLEHGRKFDGGAYRMNDMDDMHAGYYGELGYEVMHNLLVDQFMDDTKDASHNLVRLANQSHCTFAPFSAQDFLLKVLLPELVCMLIQDAEKRRTGKAITLLEAKAIRDASQRYGVAMFPIPDATGEDEDEEQMTREGDDDEGDDGRDEEEEDDEMDIGAISWLKYSVYDEEGDDVGSHADGIGLPLKAGDAKEMLGGMQKNQQEVITVSSSSSSSQSAKRKRGQEIVAPESLSAPTTQSPSRPRPRPSTFKHETEETPHRKYENTANITSWTCGADDG